ncbi:hypothetical protein QV13_12660 [Mesorhizobium hungaricum]|uniref:Uncharacterized protein n=1 Tax=Mesorhizobium hungaricum TaxID=1566387 RepID=A0A1C2DSF7_9HYPH|nr:hypothetical protein QV13_12660 [Mesorhizobium hungaricum]
MADHQLRQQARNEAIVADLRNTAGVGAPLDQKMIIKRKAAEISTAMALLYGGDWRVQFDLEEGLVLIARRLPDIR